ncbi:MAG: PLP-dependent aminotransferase family protein [Coriobacteriales bacterium]|jgi:GntR family transcriptional regulator/MocR family aminotransferase|nr:PLP-dependent aminotransferase family protein [Coriobacteriales bacterium]
MITLDRTSHKPLYRQVYEQLRDHIMSGDYPAGTKLPPIRRLADDLRISRNTVESAYLQLSQEGYVNSRAGSGFAVAPLDLMPEGSQANQQERSRSVIKRLRPTALWLDEPDETTGAAGQRRQPSASQPSASQPAAPQSSASQSSVEYDFTYGNLQEGSFPAQVWRQLTNEALFGCDAYKVSIYTSSLGEQGLRRQIAQSLHITSGVNCHPSQVVIQAGTQASLYNLLTLFDPLRDVVAMEEPGYDGARRVFENARFRVLPVPVLEGDDAFIDGLYHSHARLAYVTPSSQFPTGQILQQGARQRLLKWASTEDAYLIEDDYCREFRYTARPLPSLQSLDRDERVIYLGTFSKALAPALRMNYLVLPPDLLFQWHKLFENHYPEVPWLSQAVLESYMEQGYWAQHLRRVQAQNKRKYQLLIDALHTCMGDRVSLMENGSGLHILVGVNDGRHQNELVEQALDKGVKVYDTNRYWMSSQHPLENYVLVGFSAIAEAQIEPGIQRLAEAWF